MKTTSPYPKKGFSLIEVMTALSIFGFLSAGLVSFFVMNLNMSYMTTGKLLVGSDVRSFTNELSNNGRTASALKIYTSFNDRTEVLRGASGDMVVFVHLVADRLPNRDLDGNPIDATRVRGDKYQRVERIEGYYRNGLPGDDGAEVRHFMVDLTALPNNKDANPYHEEALIERLLDGDIMRKAPPINDDPISGEEGIISRFLPQLDELGSAQHRVVLELSRGLAEGVLFYNYQGQSVIVRGEIIHPGNRQKRATNTYNFTVTPRG